MKCDCKLPNSFNPKLSQIFKCDDCGSDNWCSDPTSRELSKIPRITDSGSLEEGDEDDFNFIREILSKPKRTRLDAILTFLDSKVKGPTNQLPILNDKLSNFGLKLERIFTKNTVVKDESLILCHSGYVPKQTLLDECNDPTPKGENTAERWDLNSFNMLGSLLLGGYKAKQKDTIRQCMDKPGSLTVAALPTGYGKTRIAQVITWLNRKDRERGPTLLISPLIALIDDQRDQFSKFNDVLEEAGHDPLKTYFLTEAEGTSTRVIMEQLLRDEVDILCCSPETIMSPVSKSHWVEVFLKMKNPFSLMVVDEAHTIGDWGASIRPEFQLLGWVKDRLLEVEPGLRVLLMSATITEDEERELLKLFRRGLIVKPRVKIERIREDLAFNVLVRGNDERIFSGEWMEFLSKERRRIPSQWFENQGNVRGTVGEPPLLSFTPSKEFAKDGLRKLAVDHIAGGNKNLVKVYTGDSGTGQRDSLRRLFLEDKIQSMVATSAFGMGIDKEDVWTISYFGMPYTLKGLYQAFGRSARKSNWESKDESTWRSGNCLAVIPDNPPRPFRMQLGIMKTIERLWDMFHLSEEAAFTRNGYAVVPVISNDESTRAYWSPIPNWKYDGPDDEEEDSRDDWSFKQTLAAWAESESKEMKKKFSFLKRRESLFRFNMWTISCLQRTDKVEFLGLHPPIISRNREDKQENLLIELLEDKGYPGVISAIRDTNPKWQTPSGQVRMAVLKFRTQLTGNKDLIDLVESGHRYLHQRHTLGREELKNFLNQAKMGTCLRTAFAPAIGIKGSSAKKCPDQSTNAKSQMPCSNCRKKIGFPSLEKSGFIWSTQENLMLIKGQKVPKRKPKKPPDYSNSEMREAFEAGKSHAIICRKSEEIFIPNKITSGALQSSKYELLDINRKAIASIEPISDKEFDFSTPGIEWSERSTAVLFFKDYAIIVDDSIVDLE